MKTVLCVDDHIEELSPLLAQARRELGVDMIVATSYETAVNLLRSTTVDAFVLDIELSVDRSTGIQLANHIRCLPGYITTPIVFVSMYSHYSKRLLTTIRNCAFLTKPLHPQEFIRTLGSCLGIEEYVRQQSSEPFCIPVQKNSYLEIDPQNISYIEVNRNVLTVQYIRGETLTTKCDNGCFKSILTQIEEQSITCLRQIYRSIIINIDQVKEIDLKGNIGAVTLFGDSNPIPIGSRYRDQLEELL